MKRVKLLVCLVVGMFAAAKVTAQQDHMNNWLQYTLTAKLSKRFNFVSLLQYRAFDAVADSRLFLINGYLEYNIPNSPVSAGAGYMRLLLEPYINETEKDNINENRLFQQLTLRGNIGKRISMAHRYRIEERFLPDNYTTRFRYLISLKMALGKPEKTAHAFYLTLKNEIRLNVKTDPFDSDRIWEGLGYVFSPAFTLEFCWLTQLNGGNSYDHYAVFHLRHNLDFSRRAHNNP